MDRALKERIIGAIVLVLVAVLVVPVFLDGPSDESAAIVSESVTLPGQDPDARKQQTIVLERDRTEPVPVAAATVAEEARDAAGKTAKALSPPVERNDSSGRQTEPVEPPATSPTGMWAVQLGSFSNQENAERLAADLRSEGYAAFLSKLSRDGDALHRVRVGPQKDKESAEAVARRLNDAGHAGQVVPHP